MTERAMPKADADATGSPGPGLDRLEELTEEAARLSEAARRYIDRYPLVTLGAVVLAGYLVGRALRR